MKTSTSLNADNVFTGLAIVMQMFRTSPRDIVDTTLRQNPGMFLSHSVRVEVQMLCVHVSRSSVCHERAR